MKIVNVPIEPIPNRYSEDWAKWFEEELKKRNFESVTVSPTPLRLDIKDGAFLDVLTTQHYKSQQIQKICELVDCGYIRRNERVVFLIHDGWFPIEQLAYIRDMLGCYDWKFIGLFHAGTYDPWDQTAQHKMYTWGEDYENAMFKIYDKVVVASYYHSNLLRNTRQITPNRISIIPWKVEVPSFVPALGVFKNIKGVIKKNQIVFPHRLNVEKQPDKLDKVSVKLIEKAPDWTTVSTACECTSKEDYYNVLQESKIAVSFSLQETFGIAMVEAVMSGCLPLVPDRLSYRELYPPVFRYEDDADLAHKLEVFTKNWSAFRNELLVLQTNFQDNSANFFPELFDQVVRTV